MDCSRVSGDAVDRGPARKSAQLIVFGRWFGAGRIVATVELSGDRQASLSSGGTDEIQDLLIHSCSASTIRSGLTSDWPWTTCFRLPAGRSAETSAMGRLP
jgi:hypothetical protein